MADLQHRMAAVRVGSPGVIEENGPHFHWKSDSRKVAPFTPPGDQSSDNNNGSSPAPVRSPVRLVRTLSEHRGDNAITSFESSDGSPRVRKSVSFLGNKVTAPPKGVPVRSASAASVEQFRGHDRDRVPRYTQQDLELVSLDGGAPGSETDLKPPPLGNECEPWGLPAGGPGVAVGEGGGSSTQQLVHDPSSDLTFRRLNIIPRWQLMLEALGRSLLIVLISMSFSSIQFMVPVAEPNGHVGVEHITFLAVALPVVVVQQFVHMIMMMRRTEPRWHFKAAKFYVPCLIYAAIYIGWGVYCPLIQLLPLGALIPSVFWSPIMQSYVVFLPKDYKAETAFQERWKKLKLFFNLFSLVILVSYGYVFVFSFCNSVYLQILVNIGYGLGCYLCKRSLMRVAKEATGRWTLHAAMVFVIDAIQITFQNLMFMAVVGPLSVVFSAVINLVLQGRQLMICSEAFQQKRHSYMGAKYMWVNLLFNDLRFSQRTLTMRELRRLSANTFIFGNFMAHLFAAVAFAVLSFMMRDGPNSRFYPFTDAALLAGSGFSDQYLRACLYVVATTAVELISSLVFVNIVRKVWNVNDNLAFVVHVLRNEQFFMVGYVLAVFAFIWSCFNYHYQIFAFAFRSSYLL